MRVTLLLCILLIAGFSPAQAELLTTLLSTNRVEIHSTYTGAEIVLFGAIDDPDVVPKAGEYQVAVTVTGPRNTLVVRHKERAGLIWLNRSRQRFNEVPGFHALLTSRPMESMISLDMQDHLGFSPVSRATPPLTDPDFLGALLRLKRADKLYQTRNDAVGFVTPRLFQTRIDLPAIAPLGRYFVETSVFQGGALLVSSKNEFFLSKTGFEALVATEARSRPWIYGLAAILGALAMGWLASVAFRRD